MNAWEVLRYVHKIGSPINGTVTGFLQNAFILSQTDSAYRCLLPLHNILDDSTNPNPDQLPRIGQHLTTVVSNFVDGVLYLSARPKDTHLLTVQQWQAYYAYIDTLQLGSVVRGRVVRPVPFGLSVDIGAPYLGLIDIGHVRLSGGDQLPQDRSAWPVKGSEIECKVSYLRLHGRQIGLGWVTQELNRT